MKAIPIVLLMLITVSCKKEQKFCWKCYILGPSTYNRSINVLYPMNATICDKNQTDIDALENANLDTTKFFNGSTYQTNVVKIITCAKQ